MLVKKYFIDIEHYSPKDNRIYGDMGFTFCDMPESRCDTLDEAKENVKFGIKENLAYYLDNEDNDIFIIYEYTFDTDKFEVYGNGEVNEDYEINSDAIVNKKMVYAMCSPINEETFEKLNVVWKKIADFKVEIYSLVR